MVPRSIEKKNESLTNPEMQEILKEMRKMEPNVGEEGVSRQKYHLEFLIWDKRITPYPMSLKSC